MASILTLLGASVSLYAQGQNIRPGAAARTGSTSTTNRTAAAGRTVTGVGATSAFTSGSRQYRNNTVLGDASIQVDPETRSLVVIADEQTHAEIMKVIRELDRPKPQVLIKVLFADVVYNDDIDLGLEASYNFHAGNPTTTGSAVGAIGSIISTATNIIPILSGTTVTGGLSTITTSTTSIFPSNLRNATLGSASLFGLANSAAPFAAAGATGNLVSVLTNDYQATLRAIAQKGHVNLLSRPSIMARNNQEAVIVVGQEVPFVTSSQITNTGQTINTIQYNDVGTILRITPFITSNKSVEMIVAPEISSVSPSTVQVTNGVTANLIDKRSAETVVVTPNATTVVIGGLITTDKSSTLQKVPILGDIPILGLPFRHLTRHTTKRELVIFLTPYIVETPNEFKEVTLGEINRTELLPKEFTRKELNTNLDSIELIDQNSKTMDSYEVRRAIPVNEDAKVLVRPSFR